MSKLDGRRSPFNTIQHTTRPKSKIISKFKLNMVWGEHVKFHINLKNMFDSPWRCSCDVSDVQSLNITVFYYRTCGWYCFLSDYGSLNCLLRAGGLTFYEHISLNVEPVISQIFSILSIARMILTFLHFYLLKNSHFMAITLDVELLVW